MYIDKVGSIQTQTKCVPTQIKWIQTKSVSKHKHSRFKHE